MNGKNDFYQCLNENLIQAEELWITNLVQSKNWNIDSDAWKKLIFLIFEKSIFYNCEKTTVTSIQKGMQRK